MRKVIGVGETVFDIIFKDNKPVSATPGGSVFNSMISLGRAGINSCFFSETGDDKIGNIICDFALENNVDASNVDRNGKSHISLAFLNQKNDAEYTFYKDHPKDKANITLPIINKDDILLIGSYYAINPVIRTKIYSILNYAKNQGAIIYYDVNFRKSHSQERELLKNNFVENFEFADIIKGSNEDFSILFDMDNFDDVYNQKIKKYSENFIYTCGLEPIHLQAVGVNDQTFGVKKIDTISTIGAGDNFNAGFVYSLIKLSITKADLQKGLSMDTWAQIIANAQSFAQECCMSWDNYISLDFAKKLK